MTSFQRGDRVVFTANGVTGVVVDNLGSAVNTLTGDDVIEWFTPGSDGGRCVHESSKLTKI
jgi:hypothetical protein